MDAGVEEKIRALCERDARDEATTAALKAYGDETLRFIHALVRNEADASEVFSVFAEDLWHSLPTFQWACSLRTWVYVLARRATARSHRRAWKKRAVLGSSPAIDAAVHQVRTNTLTYLRTETKTKLRALRDSLDEDDRTLLVLRVDRALAWEDLARVFAPPDADEDVLRRESARLRKRFQLVKDRLRKLAEEAGLR